MSPKRYRQPRIIGVHLDLKGVMFRPGYIPQLAEDLAHRNINTVLVEYEDIFPFRDIEIAYDRSVCRSCDPGAVGLFCHSRNPSLRTEIRRHFAQRYHGDAFREWIRDLFDLHETRLREAGRIARMKLRRAAHRYR